MLLYLLHVISPEKASVLRSIMTLEQQVLLGDQHLAGSEVA